MFKFFFKNLIFFIHIFLFLPSVKAQDHFQNEIFLKTLLKNKFKILSRERVLVTISRMRQHFTYEPIFDSLKNSILEETENSRNRDLMALANIEISKIYQNTDQRNGNIEMAKIYIDRCLEIAKEAGIESYKVAAFNGYASFYLRKSLPQKALDYNNHAISLATSLGSDSLLSSAYGSIAKTYDKSHSNLLKFQSLLNQRLFAEKSASHSLMVRSYLDLGDFYYSINNYEKAKDFYKLAVETGKLWQQNLVIFYSYLGFFQAYIGQNNEKMALEYFNKDLHFLDSLGITSAKLILYFKLFNYYIDQKDPQVGLDYITSHPETLQYLKMTKGDYQLKKVYALIKTKQQQYDSALYYLKSIAPFVYKQNGNFQEKFYFSSQLAGVYKALKNNMERISNILKADKFADSSQSLDLQRLSAMELDSLNKDLGDYKNSRKYFAKSIILKDSITSLGKEKDILNSEIDNFNKRAEKEKEENQKIIRERDSLEYVGITAGIAAIFILLVIFGVFKISPTVIKGLGFFAFIFLFEFIILLLDKQIHHLTEGQPWKVLGIKIIIIAFLLPLHHYLEEKMLHFLTHRMHSTKDKFLTKEN